MENNKIIVDNNSISIESLFKSSFKIFLDNILMKESKEIVEDLIVAAHNDAKSKLKKKTSEEISKVTGGIDLPPNFKFPFQ